VRKRTREVHGRFRARAFRAALAGTFALFAAAIDAFAGVNSSVPQYLNFQGGFADNAGAALSGTYDIRFSLKNGGTVFWAADYSAVVITNGSFSVLLGTPTQGGQSCVAFLGNVAGCTSATASGAPVPISAALLTGAGVTSASTVEVQVDVNDGT